MFVSSLFVHENQSQESLSTRRVPWGQERVKNDDFQYPPLQKIRSLASRQIFIEKLPNESVCPKTSSGTTFGTPITSQNLLATKERAGHPAEIGHF